MNSKIYFLIFVAFIASAVLVILSYSAIDSLRQHLLTLENEQGNKLTIQDFEIIIVEGEEAQEMIAKASEAGIEIIYLKPNIVENSAGEWIVIITMLIILYISVLRSYSLTLREIWYFTMAVIDGVFSVWFSWQLLVYHNERPSLFYDTEPFQLTRSNETPKYSVELI